MHKGPGYLKAILQQARKNALPLIFVVPGSGQIARYAIEGGAQFLMVLNVGLYRISGVSPLCSYLPFANANDQTDALLRYQIMPRSRKIPVVAGVLAGDPVMPLQKRFRRLQELGVSGIVNWPATGLIDGKIRKALAKDGFDLKSETGMLLEAKRQQFTTFGFATSPQAAASMAEAETDALVLNIGWTHETHDIYEKADRIQYAVSKINEMLEAVKKTNRDPICLFFGGSITSAEDSAELYRRTKIVGFGGGSAFERIPIAKLVTNTVRQFCSVPLRKKTPPSNGGGLGEMVGTSPVMQKIFDLTKRVAPFDVNVVIEGETGVGKELVATQLHRLSHRASFPFITLNCGAIPDTLIESEFFGHERGAFTGAVNRRLGKFELADRGTLFLDEVAELSSKAQVSLLRVIQQKEILRVGGEKTIPVDVRIIAATHRNLKELVIQEKFRADLYFRLNMITLEVPPLRTHPRDIPAIVQRFLTQLGAQYGKSVWGVSKDFMHGLLKHSWPGNVRELKHVLGRVILLEDGPILEGKDFEPELLPHHAREFRSYESVEMRMTLRETEDQALQSALRISGGNKSKAARLLGISRKTLYGRLKRIQAPHKGS